MKIHIVREGDTMWDLVQKYNTPLERILEANPQIEDADQLKAGIKVRIPTGRIPVLNQKKDELEPVKETKSEKEIPYLEGESNQYLVRESSSLEAPFYDQHHPAYWYDPVPVMTDLPYLMNESSYMDSSIYEGSESSYSSLPKPPKYPYDDPYSEYGSYPYPYPMMGGLVQGMVPPPMAYPPPPMPCMPPMVSQMYVPPFYPFTPTAPMMGWEEPVSKVYTKSSAPFIASPIQTQKESSSREG